MSERHPTDKERARQAEHLAALKQKATKAKRPAKVDDDETDDQVEPLAVGRLYTSKTLQRAMAINRRYFDGLLREGMPYRKIKGRYWFSGRLVIEWMEGRQEDGSKTGKR